jgi:hypothetical protein
MDKIPITKDVCMDYVVEEMAIGNPIVWSMFEYELEKSGDFWITFATFDKVAEIVYQHAIKYDI